MNPQNKVHPNAKARNQAAARRQYEKRKTEKKCVSCGGERDLAGKTYCAACLDRVKKLYRTRISQGLCGKCGHSSLFTPTRCLKCRNKHRDDRRELKKEVLAAYGGKCSCCGATEFEFLGIEHSRGDGAAHKRKIGKYGNPFYAELKKQGFPQDLGLEVHCMNCNFSKGKYGYCPHKNSLTAYSILW